MFLVCPTDHRSAIKQNKKLLILFSSEGMEGVNLSFNQSFSPVMVYLSFTQTVSPVKSVEGKSRIELWHMKF